MKQIIKKIKTAKTIAVFCHSKPDPDALGALFALSEGLKRIGKEVKTVLEEPIKKKYEFLAEDYITEFPENCDLYICVDVAAPHMLGKFEKNFLAKENTIEIDHHANRTMCAKLSYVEKFTASCSEIIYKVLKNLKVKIDERLATLIYMGLAGDTGCFLHENTTVESHILAAELMKCGAKVFFINRRLFKSNTKDKLKLIKLALSKFEYYKDTLIVAISYADFKSIGYNPDEGVDLIDFVSSIEGVNLTALLTERKPEICSISFRSSEKYDVSKLAERFGGGGHKGASGCKDLPGKIEDIEKQLKKEIKDFIKE